MTNSLILQCFMMIMVSVMGLFGCGNLKSITIPQSATYIGENALKTHKETITDEDGFVRTTYTNIPEIRGVKGSYAETYAKENGIYFVEIESN